jgi:polysaccharide export outer membrane protein
MRAVMRTVVVAGAVFAGGCADERRSDPNAEGPVGVFRPASSMRVSATEYRVAPPDKLVVHASGVKELDQFTTTIRPDGVIEVGLLGEMNVAGKTPQEIGAMLTAAASRLYNNIEVRVAVSEYNSKFYHVFGTAVREGGPKAYTGRNTVVSALCQAGFTAQSWPQQVHVSRPARDGQARATAVIDMTRVYLDGDTRQNYLLEEGDIVYVPTSPLAVWDEKTRQMLGPLSTGAGTAGAVQGVGSTK